MEIGDPGLMYYEKHWEFFILLLFKFLFTCQFFMPLPTIM